MTAVCSGTAFQRGQLYNMLKNPLYIGRIRHGAKTYPGSHPAIIDLVLWEKVQAQLNDNIQGAQLGPTAKDPSLLAGKVVDEQGRPLVATHASKGKVRYRYYVSRHLQHRLAKGDGNKRPDGLRIPARELEQVVLQAIVGQLKDPIAMVEQLGASTADPKHAASLVTRSAEMLSKLDGKRGLAVQVLLARILQRVTILEDAVRIAFDPAALGKELGLPAEAVISTEMSITIPARIRRSGLTLSMGTEVSADVGA